MAYYYGLSFDVGPNLLRSMLLTPHNYKHFTAKANPAYANEDLHLSLAPDNSMRICVVWMEVRKKK